MERAPSSRGGKGAASGHDSHRRVGRVEQKEDFGIPWLEEGQSRVGDRAGVEVSSVAGWTQIEVLVE